MKSKLRFLIAIVLAGLLLASYGLYAWLTNDVTKITVRDGGEKPVFELAGRGRMLNALFLSPHQRPTNSQGSFILWQINFAGDPAQAKSVSTVGFIEYGVVPPGFKQIRPERDEPPPPLRTGEKYHLQVTTQNTSRGQFRFEMRDGKAVEIPLE
jgi:hypothetical protein